MSESYHTSTSSASLEDKKEGLPLQIIKEKKPMIDSYHTSTSSLSVEDKKEGHPSPLPPAKLVYHESAHSIVFRDHLRRQHKAIEKKKKKLRKQRSNLNSIGESVDDDDKSVGSQASSELPVLYRGQASENVIMNFTPQIQPLASLELTSEDVFEPLLEVDTSIMEHMSEEERSVFERILQEAAVVKTVRNTDWTSFLAGMENDNKTGKPHRTSVTLLPKGGKKMRCFGSEKEFTCGVLFALPAFSSEEEENAAVASSKTWIWPAGYAAKTEFNVDRRHGTLINGREEALVSFAELRKNNEIYRTSTTGYELGGRFVKGGLSAVPYNEIYLFIGGGDKEEPSLERGVGTPIALFCRTPTYAHLIHLFRTRARVSARLSHPADDPHPHARDENAKQLPLFYISPQHGAIPIGESLQRIFWKNVARNLNPFQNPTLWHKTDVHTSDETAMQQKLEELIDLEHDAGTVDLTQEECARIAGGFGATDDSVAKLLMGVAEGEEGDTNTTGRLQGIVNEGLTAAVRSGDYHTSRQLLILYTLVASKKKTQSTRLNNNTNTTNGYQSDGSTIMMRQITTSTADSRNHSNSKTKLKSESSFNEMMTKLEQNTDQLSAPIFTVPPPPPLDTDRLRSATNSDGLLAVLGAAESLKAMQDGSARKRVEEAILAIDEWIEIGEENLAFRLSSWHSQRLAQGDLEIATEKDTNFAAFLGNKAVANRKKFALQLRQSLQNTHEHFFSSVDFLKVIHDMLNKMNSPCLRLELLQYILGLDNRYSVAHVARSVELAATCLNIGVGAMPEG